MANMGDYTAEGQPMEVRVSQATTRGRARAGRVAAGLRSSVTSATSRARQGVQSNPLGFALGGVGLGMLAGMLAPTGRKEAQAMQPTASRLRTGAQNVRAAVSDVAREAAFEARQVEQQRKQAG